MDFREATDALFERVDHAELAEALGVSIASIRQARLDATARAHRTPPQGWEDAVIQLAERRVQHYRGLLAHVRTQQGKSARLAHENRDEILMQDESRRERRKDAKTQKVSGA